ncbi:MAG: hypothetical protein ACYDHC_06200 [Desulfuromonadaceae bacterium]
MKLLKRNFKKIIALTLVVMITCLSINTVFSVAHEIEEAGISFASDPMSIGFLHVEASGHCPSCPADNHPSTDHEHFTCDHHNYTSLTAQTVYRHPAPVELPLVSLYASRFIPEVFLDIDTPPPQNFPDLLNEKLFREFSGDTCIFRAD